MWTDAKPSKIIFIRFLSSMADAFDMQNNTDYSCLLGSGAPPAHTLAPIRAPLGALCTSWHGLISATAALLRRGSRPRPFLGPRLSVYVPSFLLAVFLRVSASGPPVTVFIYFLRSFPLRGNPFFSSPPIYTPGVDPDLGRRFRSCFRR